MQTAQITSQTPVYARSVYYARSVAQELGLGFDLIDRHSGYLCRLYQGSAHIFIGGGALFAWPVNTAASAALAKDKAFCSQVLQRDGLPVVPTSVVFTSKRYAQVRAPGQEPEDAPALAQHFGFPLVAKPNQGARGAYVKLCHDEAALQAHLKRMSPRYDVAILQPLTSGAEYRVFVMEDEAVFAYRKENGTLKADGVRSVRQIITDFCNLLQGLGLNGPDAEDPGITAHLEEAGYTLDDIPPEGFVLERSIQANIAYGAEICDFTTQAPPSLADTARRAAKSCNLVVAGVDIIFPTESLEEPRILEVNANPGIASLEDQQRFDLAHDLFRRAISRAFDI